MKVELEHGPRRGTVEVDDRDEQFWVVYLGGKNPNIRRMKALYTYSRTDKEGKIIFRYRRSTELEPVSS